MNMKTEAIIFAVIIPFLSELTKRTNRKDQNENKINAELSCRKFRIIVPKIHPLAAPIKSKKYNLWALFE